MITPPSGLTSETRKHYTALISMFFNFGESSFQKKDPRKPRYISLVQTKKTAGVFFPGKVARYDDVYRSCGPLNQLGGIGAHSFSLAKGRKVENCGWLLWVICWIYPPPRMPVANEGLKVFVERFATCSDTGGDCCWVIRGWTQVIVVDDTLGATKDSRRRWMVGRWIFLFRALPIFRFHV